MKYFERGIRNTYLLLRHGEAVFNVQNIWIG